MSISARYSPLTIVGLCLVAILAFNGCRDKEQNVISLDSTEGLPRKITDASTYQQAPRGNTRQEVKSQTSVQSQQAARTTISPSSLGYWSAPEDKISKSSKGDKVEILDRALNSSSNPKQSRNAMLAADEAITIEFPPGVPIPAVLASSEGLTPSQAKLKEQLAQEYIDNLDSQNPGGSNFGDPSGKNRRLPPNGSGAMDPDERFRLLVGQDQYILKNLDAARVGLQNQ